MPFDTWIAGLGGEIPWIKGQKYIRDRHLQHAWINLLFLRNCCFDNDMLNGSSLQKNLANIGFPDANTYIMMREK